MAAPFVRPTSASPSQRMLRVAETVRQSLADMVSRGEIEDPALKGKVLTFPEVRMSPDLMVATVYVMPLGGIDSDLVAATLNKITKPIRGGVGRRLRDMKNIPELRFRADDRFDEAMKIDALLNTPKVKRDLG